jgi:hypothetical protein
MLRLSGIVEILEVETDDVDVDVGIDVVVGLDEESGLLRPRCIVVGLIFLGILNGLSLILLIFTTAAGMFARCVFVSLDVELYSEVEEEDDVDVGIDVVVLDGLEDEVGWSQLFAFFVFGLNVL